jgi:solute carrier family 12 (potassium/chloride transporters), member 9
MALFILLLGDTMVTLTTLSLSAIATNGRIKGGGAYYMISRSLGPAMGGGVGIVFYCANVFGGGTYISGFVSSLIELPGLQPDYVSYWWQFLYGSIALFVIMIVCIVGAGKYSNPNPQLTKTEN